MLRVKSKLTCFAKLKAMTITTQHSNQCLLRSIHLVLLSTYHEITYAINYFYFINVLQNECKFAFQLHLINFNRNKSDFIFLFFIKNLVYNKGNKLIKIKWKLIYFVTFITFLCLECLLSLLFSNN
jgi:hypothetical protein